MYVLRTVAAAVAATALIIASTAIVTAARFGTWSTPVSVESIAGVSGAINTSALEGCAFVAQRDDTLYFASNRAGGEGGLDIWYSVRKADGAWGDPVNFSEVNTAANELCPTAHRDGRTFLFVSSRAGGCGGDDLYVTRNHATRGWTQPENLGCAINSSANEAGPSLVEGEFYFSSTRAGGIGDVYVSSFDGSTFGPPALVASLNSAQDDLRPNVSRDGLEVFFDSNRPGGSGGLDLWTSTRETASSPWAIPTNLGTGVNSVANDLRASLSWDGNTLYFGSVRSGGEGSQDIFVTTR